MENHLIHILEIGSLRSVIVIQSKKDLAYLIFFLNISQYKYLKFLNQHSDLSTLWWLPQVSGNIEEGSLEEEDKADPLVVFVVLDIFTSLQVSVGWDTWVRDGVTLLSSPTGWDWIGGVDPAVCVHDPAGNTVNNTVNGVTNVLTWCHQKRRDHKDDQSGLVMETEDIAKKNQKLESLYHQGQSASL